MVLIFNIGLVGTYYGHYWTPLDPWGAWGARMLYFGLYELKRLYFLGF